jgi:hypothetical protein
MMSTFCRHKKAAREAVYPFRPEFNLITLITPYSRFYAVVIGGNKSRADITNITIFKTTNHQQMHKESSIINRNTLLHVLTLLGHLQEEFSLPLH